MDKHNDEIGELLESFNRQKESRDKRNIEPLEPPKKRDNVIDFAKKDEPTAPIQNNISSFEKKPNIIKATKPKKERKTPEEIEKAKAKRKEKLNEALSKAKTIVFDKRFFIPVIAVIVVVAMVFSAIGIVNYKKTAYLRPYQKEYPSVTFPDGIMKKYCDDFGKNPSLQGYIKIDDISYDGAVDSMNSQALADGAKRFNYVVYLDNDKLESVYATADGYNKATKKISYTDLINEYTFEVVGAFYTNTNENDDDGYIFPYDTTEEMTQSSINAYIDRISSRLIYETNTGGISKLDTILTISCPTNYNDGYRFVVVCKMVDKLKENLTATKKNSSHLTQKEYDEKGIINPYRFASKWYPEIIITDQNGKTVTIKRSIDYYRK